MLQRNPRILVLSLVLAFTRPACAYDIPLSESAIRDAYFLGKRTGGLNAEFIASYSRQIPQLKQGNCTSTARVETPFLKVAIHSSDMPNYSAQAAVKDFFGKTLAFDVHLDICYTTHAPQNAIRFKIIQNKKEMAPLSVQRSPYEERTEFGALPPNGEQIDLEFKAEALGSSDLTIVIDTPDGQHGEAVIALGALR